MDEEEIKTEAETGATQPQTKNHLDQQQEEVSKDYPLQGVALPSWVGNFWPLELWERTCLF